MKAGVLGLGEIRVDGERHAHHIVIEAGGAEMCLVCFPLLPSNSPRGATIFKHLRRCGSGAQAAFSPRVTLLFPTPAVSELLLSEFFSLRR